MQKAALSPIVLEIWPSGRAIRRRLAELSESEAIHTKLMTIEAFLAQAAVVTDARPADETVRLLNLREAAREVPIEEAFGFTTEFLSFVQSSPHLFSLWDEMALEEVELERLADCDPYAHYDEHLSTLIALRDAYRRRMTEAGYTDRSIPHSWQLNHGWLSGFAQAKLHLEGYLTRRDMRIIEEVAACLPVRIFFRAGPYSRRIAARLEAWSDRALEEGYLYELLLPECRCIQVTPLTAVRLERATVESFSARSLQAKFVFRILGEWIAEGLNPADIAVITPDEGFAQMLALYDEHHILNFAMGTPLGQTHAYRLLDLYRKELHGQPRTPRQAQLFDTALFGAAPEKADAAWLRTLCATLPLSRAERTLYEEELFLIERLLRAVGAIDPAELLSVWLGRLGGRSLDDVRGGEVTVMGALEGRGLAFSGVIIVDANEELVPSPSPKELFLDSGLRQRAGLPTRRERDELQKYYYAGLLARAGRIALSYTVNDHATPSRFLTELGAPEPTPADERYRALLGSPVRTLSAWEPDTHTPDFDPADFLFSASSLKSLLTCRRQFWLRYIKKLRTAESSTPQRELGILLHEKMHAFYRTQNNPSALESYLHQSLGNIETPLLRLEADLFLDNAAALAQSETERYAQGWRPMQLEAKFESLLGGLKIKGVIDRIDLRGTEALVIDYKYKGSRTYEGEAANDKAVDFQPVFYRYGAASLLPEAEVRGFAWLDLRSGRLIADDKADKREEIFVEKAAAVLTHPPYFEKCSNLWACQMCDYRGVCQR